jgi:hypothetical protein
VEQEDDLMQEAELFLCKILDLPVPALVQHQHEKRRAGCAGIGNDNHVAPLTLCNNIPCFHFACT